jgi:hypothetical protein
VAEIVAPHGTRWSVRLAWAHRPWRVRWRRLRKADSGLDYLEPVGGLAEGISGVAAFVALVAVVVLAIFVLVPLLLVLLDVVVVMLLVVLGFVFRVVFRRPWRIEADASDGRTLAWGVTGYRNSREKIREIESALRLGLPLPAGCLERRQRAPDADESGGDDQPASGGG